MSLANPADDTPNALNISRGMTRISPRLLRMLVWSTVSGLAGSLLAISWGRWVDPVIDFGREVYLPWRVLHGEHPGRDFVHPYGPLSVYWNAGVFAVGGVSVRTLVLANLAVFAALVYLLHGALRRSFGYLPAAAATLVAVAGFGFPHYWGINNYTYAAPYSHEATHGMLALLALLAWLGRSRGRPSLGNGLGAGILFGLCSLTKTEYVVSGGAVLLATTVRFWLARSGRNSGSRGDAWAKRSPAEFGCGVLAGTCLADLLALGTLTLAMPIKDAILLASNAFLAPFVYADYSKSAHVLRFLGADNLSNNLRTVALWGLTTVTVITLLTLATRRLGHRGAKELKWAFGAAVLGLALAAVFLIPWLFCGSAFPALLLTGSIILGLKIRARSRTSAPMSLRQWNQVLLLLAAVAMLARMAFDPTISHYGFFQALLAASWISAFLIGEWPVLASPSSWVRRTLIVGVLLLQLGGAALLVRTSLKFYQAKTTPVGEGADRILGYASSVHLMPELWELARRFIVANSTPQDTLLVIPEGISLNYWTRRRHPVRIIDLLPATLRLNRGDVLTELKAQPPDWVVLASRSNMAELGFKAYGQDLASGQAIVEWVKTHYTRAAHDGTPPFAPDGVGIEIYRRSAP